MQQYVLGPQEWSDISAFVAVVSAGSFGSAAATMRTSSSTISRAIKRLEHRLGVQLLHRTTRAMSLTEAGQAYFDRVSQGLAELETAERSVSEGLGTARGVLRLCAPATFGRAVLTPLLVRFMRANPELELDVRFSEYALDVVADGIDVALRMGKPKRGGLLISKLARNRRVVCATRDYLARHGAPQRPEELRHHTCLSYKRQGTEGWGFATSRGEMTLVLPSILRADAGEVLRAAALEGIGIAYLPWFLVAEDVKAKRLFIVLEAYETRANWLYAAYTEAVRRVPKVTALVAFLRRELAEQVF